MRVPADAGADRRDRVAVFRLGIDMTELEELWRRKSDGEIVDALVNLSDYSFEAQALIRAESTRRALEAPSVSPMAFAEAQSVARLHHRFAALVLAQWLSLVVPLVVNGLIPVELESILRLVAALIVLAGMVALPILGFRLLKRLNVDSPGRMAIFMYMPLFSLMALPGLKSFAVKWGRLHDVDVNFFGPTDAALARLRDLEQKPQLHQQT